MDLVEPLQNHNIVSAEQGTYFPSVNSLLSSTVKEPPRIFVVVFIWCLVCCYLPRVS